MYLRERKVIFAIIMMVIDRWVYMGGWIEEEKDTGMNRVMIDDKDRDTWI